MHVAVLDIGKSNIKAAVVDLASGCECAARSRPNRVLQGPPYPHFDVDAMFDFFVEALAEFQAEPGFAAISVTTHGAAAALIGADGLAMPVLDYEFAYPEPISRAYDALRPPFSETFSPRLPAGLNLGAQLHYLKSAFPYRFSAAQAVVTYPQYWGWRLTGRLACDVTSLGCHTDLWMPGQRRFSSLVDQLGLTQLLAPVMQPFERLGTVSAEIADRIGLKAPVPVFCGIHDSNASLLPHLMSRSAPFAVVSSGTWVVAFAVGGDVTRLDPRRDSLANVDAFGRPVASARFMGGREFAAVTDGRGTATAQALGRVLDERIMVLPSVVPGSGPFPAARHRILNERGLDADERHVAASLYCALMTHICLELTCAAGPIVVEGPFAANGLFVEALGRVTGRPVLPMGGATGTALGAALLAGGRDAAPVLPPPLAAISPRLPADFDRYAATWTAASCAQDDPLGVRAAI